jgi:hypothetical protein
MSKTKYPGSWFISPSQYSEERKHSKDHGHHFCISWRWKYFEQEDISICDDVRCDFCHSILEAYLRVIIERKRHFDVVEMVRRYLDSRKPFLSRFRKEFKCIPRILEKIDRYIINVFIDLFDNNPVFTNRESEYRMAMFLLLNPVIAQRVLKPHSRWIPHLRTLAATYDVRYFIRDYADGIDLLSPDIQRQIDSVNILADITGRDELKSIVSLFDKRPPVPEKEIIWTDIFKKHDHKMSETNSLIFDGVKNSIESLQIDMSHLIILDDDFNEGRQLIRHISHEIQMYPESLKIGIIEAYLDALYEVSDDKESFVENMIDTLYEKIISHFRDRIELINRWKRLEKIVHKN